MNSLYRIVVSVYRKYFGCTGPYQAAEALKIRLMKVSGRLVLDVGSGTGNISYGLTTQGNIIVALDVENWRLKFPKRTWS